ncbi:MAG: glycoside hydrolase family 5 protein [Treponema sp.]|nr:glycoside hydrolase family 5 protein [Treponema sp.]
MNKTIKSLRQLFTGIIALSFSMIIFAGCSDGSGSSGINIPNDFTKEKLYSTANLVTDNGSAPLGSSTASQIVGAMKFGWNLGNTLDASAGGDEKAGWAGRNENLGLDTEINWGMPQTTQAMIQGIKAKGFSSIRIPVSWHDHIDANYTINSAWMNRVKQIVDWAIAADLYVIINVHHDNITPAYCTTGCHLGYSPAASCINESKRYLYNVWCQITEAFNNGYDEHLIFETINEPRLPGDPHEWNWNSSCSTCQEAMACIKSLNQLCLETIRESGGNNAHRLIMAPSYVAAPGAAMDSSFTLPNDPAGSGHLALSVHMYSPYNFAMEDPGNSTFTDEHRGDLDYWFEQLNTKFVSHEIPVVIGEMGATNKNNTEQRTAWFQYYLGKVKDYQMAALLWDNGNYQIPSNVSYKELFGFYNRNAQTWYFPDMIEAAISARN